MPLIALPIGTDWTLDAGLELAKGNTVIQLAYSTSLFADNFDDNSVDGSKWTKYDTGTNVNEQNQRLEITGAGTDWSNNGVLGKTAFAQSGNFELRITIIPRTNSTIGLKNSFNIGQVGISLAFFGTYFAYFGFAVLLQPSIYPWTAGKTYNVRIVVNNYKYRFFIQSPDDSNYTSEIEIGSFPIPSTGNVYVMMSQSNSGPATIYDTLTVNGVSSSSPIAESPWFAVDQSTLDATAPIHIIENPLGGTGSINYQYALNNGAYNGSYITLAAMKAALAGATIIDHTNSLRIKAQFVSNGIQSCELGGLSTYAKASGVASGGGGLKIVNGGPINV